MPDCHTLKHNLAYVGPGVNLRGSKCHVCGRNCLAFKHTSLETNTNSRYKCQTATLKHNLAYVGGRFEGGLHATSVDGIVWHLNVSF